MNYACYGFAQSHQDNPLRHKVNCAGTSWSDSLYLIWYGNQYIYIIFNVFHDVTQGNTWVGLSGDEFEKSFPRFAKS